MKKNFVFGVLLMVTLVVGACSDSAGHEPGGNETVSPVITTRLAAFDGNGQTLEGENVVTDMKACLFEKGVMTRVYNNLQQSESGYNLQLDAYAGTLYMLANTDDAIDLESLQNRGIQENEWKKMTMALNGNPKNFFTGVLRLDGAGKSQSVQTVMLTRGLVRFDLQVNVAGTASVEQMTLKNVAQSAFLFAQDEGVKSPDNVVRRDTVVTFPTPLTTNTAGVLYVYEQENKGLEVCVQAVIDGQAKVMTKTLEGALKRNSIYTVTVRKDDIDIAVKVGFEDWEQGSDTELVP